MNLSHSKSGILRAMAALTLMLSGMQVVAGQQTTYRELKSLYEKEDYERCYRMAQQKGQQGLFFQAVALFRLPEGNSIRKEHKRPLIHAMDLLERSRQHLPGSLLRDSSYWKNELQKLQKTSFDKGEQYFRRGSKSRAREYFDAMHRTFDNSMPLFYNHYGFKGDHFLKTLLSNIIQEAENEKYYVREINKLIDKYYRHNEDFRKWNNPLYRMANTAASEDYLREEEKMIYYYLNLVRMNPELFRETFIEARLHVKYHGEIEIKIPVYDTLTVEDYNTPLTRDEFFNLPVHKLYIDEIPNNGASRFIQKKMIGKSEHSEKYRYDINYTGLYRYLENNHPELLMLKNLDKFSLAEPGKGRILFKLYNEKYTYYNRTYEEETAGSYYYMSLFKTLKTMDPLDPLYPDRQLYRTAECWAEEAGERGLKGHDRIYCRSDYHAEACDYGNNNGFDVVLNLLVDKYVPSLGHRKALLGDFSTMGAAIRPHDSGLEYNAVLDFKR